MATAGCGRASKVTLTHKRVHTGLGPRAESHRGTTTRKCVRCHTRVQQMHTRAQCTQAHVTHPHADAHPHTDAQPRDTLARGCTNVHGCTTAPRHGYATIARGCTPTRDTTTCGCTTTHNCVHTGSRTAARLHAHLHVQLHVGPHTTATHRCTTAHRCTAQAPVGLHVGV